VIVEHWQDNDNTVVVSESFDAAMAAKLRAALRDGAGGTQAKHGRQQEELGLGLFEIPAFQIFAEQVGERIAMEIGQEIGR
jgi:hypothetical protein